MIDEFFFSDNRAGTLGKVRQNIKRPAPEGNCHTVTPEHPLSRGQFKRAEPQVPMSTPAGHGCRRDAADLVVMRFFRVA